MTVVRIQQLSVPYEMYERVQEKVGVQADPPAGLIVHTIGEANGGLQIVDVWESEEAAQKFGEERLRPAVMEVAAAHGVDASSPPPTTSYEARNMIKP